MTDRIHGLCNVNTGGGKLCRLPDRHSGAHDPNAPIDVDPVDARPVAKPMRSLTYGELEERVARLEARMDELERASG